MNYNPSPKSELLTNPEFIKHHHALVENSILRDHINVAMLEMTRRICDKAPADNIGACAAGHLRMLGAHDFVSLFMNLAESESPERAKVSDNLPSNVSSIPTARKA